jgi:glycerophosphoryl diester phosphodiesterase
VPSIERVPGPGGRPGPLILAHRGDHRAVPENSLAAFEAALAVPGCDGVELDVRTAADGTPIVLHDATLRRVHGVAATAARMTAAELGASGVPTLKAALAVMPTPAFLDVELKDDAVAATVELISSVRGDPPPALVLSSFDPAIPERLAALVPGWPRWLNAEALDRPTVDLAAALGCSGVSVRWTAIDERSMELARDAGLGVAGWTVRRTSDARRLASLGAAALCVEGPALAGDRSGVDG